MAWMSVTIYTDALIRVASGRTDEHRYTIPRRRGPALLLAGLTAAALLAWPIRPTPPAR